MQKGSGTGLSQSNLLAIDYGTKKSGIAYSVSGFAFGLKTVKTHDLLGELEKLILQKQTKAIIVGMPYNIDGTLSTHGKRVEKWKQEIEKRIHLPIFLHDERLTSSAASMSFIEDGIDGEIDTEAARLILASYIESASEDIKDSL